MDLGAIFASYEDKQGYPPYHPRMMVKVLELHRPRFEDHVEQRQGLHPGLQRPGGAGRGQPDHRGCGSQQYDRRCAPPPRVGEVSADAGYFSEANLQVLCERGIEAFIPPEKIRHNQWREARPPYGRMPKGLDARDRMRRKLRTRRGRARYKLRQESVEPVFGQIKWNRGLRQLLLRGLASAQAAWKFECAVHNLAKMRAAGVQMA